MSVGFVNLRTTATFSRGVVVGVRKKKYGGVLQIFYSSKGVKRDLAFRQEWKLLELNPIKYIKKGNWSKLETKANIVLKLL
jgi:hypothetical protein